MAEARPPKKDGVKQRREPVDVGLGVRVEEDDNLGRGLLGSGQPGGDETSPGVHADHRDLGQLGDVVIQLHLKLGFTARVVD